MRTRLTIAVGTTILPILLLTNLPAQEGTAERIGRRIDKGLEEIREDVQQAWTDVRRSVDKLSVQGRVYGRLRWDKALAKEPIDVDVQEKDIVVLTGRVPDHEARQKALQLAKDTVGVRDVVDHLQVEPRQQAEEPNPDI